MYVTEPGFSSVLSDEGILLDNLEMLPDELSWNEDKGKIAYSISDQIYTTEIIQQRF